MRLRAQLVLGNRGAGRTRHNMPVLSVHAQRQHRTHASLQCQAQQPGAHHIEVCGCIQAQHGANAGQQALQPVCRHGRLGHIQRWQTACWPADSKQAKAAAPPEQPVPSCSTLKALTWVAVPLHHSHLGAEDSCHTLLPLPLKCALSQPPVPRARGGRWHMQEQGRCQAAWGRRKGRGAWGGKVAAGKLSLARQPLV